MIFLLFLHLLFQPVLETFIMNKSHWSITLARVQEWILRCLLISPAHFTLDIALSWIDYSTVDFDSLLWKVISSNPVIIILVLEVYLLQEVLCSLSQTLALIWACTLFHRWTALSSILMIQVYVSRNIIWSKVFNLEFYSAKLNYIAFLKFVIL